MIRNGVGWAALLLRGGRRNLPLPDDLACLQLPGTTREGAEREFTFGLIKNINVKKVLKLDNVLGVCCCTIITGIQSSLLRKSEVL